MASSVALEGDGTPVFWFVVIASFWIGFFIFEGFDMG